MTGFVYVDKPEGITSFVLGARVRKIFGEKKAGHTGTLDPMATGVMIVAIGNSTRFIELIPDHNKAYVATFRLGMTTDTLDITGKTLATCEVKAGALEVEKALESFRGEISQLPPMYSAVKKDGVRLYELARQGVEISRESRKVTVYDIKLLDSDEKADEYTIYVECSSGTYIRSIIGDIGEALGCGATMTALRRTKASGVDIEKCHTLEELKALCDEGRLSEALESVDSLVSYDKIQVTAPQAKRFSNGGELDLQRLRKAYEPGLYLVYGSENEFLGVGEISPEATALTVRRVYVGG